MLVWCVQHLLGAAANGKAFFVRAATHTGVVGLLVAFAAGYAVYGGLLLAATVALKWALVGRMRAGRHRCAALPRSLCQLCTQTLWSIIIIGSGMHVHDRGQVQCCFLLQNAT